MTYILLAALGYYLIGVVLITRRYYTDNGLVRFSELIETLMASWVIWPLVVTLDFTGWVNETKLGQWIVFQGGTGKTQPPAEQIGDHGENNGKATDR